MFGYNPNSLKKKNLIFKKKENNKGGSAIIQELGVLFLKKD